MDDAPQNRHYAFRGLETRGILLHGHIPRARAVAMAGAEPGFLHPEEDPGRCQIALLAVRIEKLKTWWLPFPRWTYPEAVWMLCLAEGDHLAVHAHTPRWMVPMLSRVDGYNTRAAKVELSIQDSAARVRIDAREGRFEAQLAGAATEVEAGLIRRLWTRNRAGCTYRIPWGAHRPRTLRGVDCQVVCDELGRAVMGSDLVWQSRGLVFEDRPHRCAPAYAESLPSRAGTGG